MSIDLPTEITEETAGMDGMDWAALQLQVQACIAAVQGDDAVAPSSDPPIYPVPSPFDLPMAIPPTGGAPATPGILTALLAEIRKPLVQRVEEKSRPVNNILGDTLCVFNKGMGVSINDDNVQLGGDGAHTMHAPAAGIISHWAHEIQQRGNLKLIPNQATRSLDLNFGPLNTSVAPPVEVQSGERTTPPIAVLTIPSVDAGSSNIVTPQPDPQALTGIMISPCDIPWLLSQSAARMQERGLESAETTLIDATTAPVASALTLQDQTISQQKAATAEQTASQIPAMYVVLPQHTHVEPGAPATWLPAPDLVVALRGLVPAYLFGYNRLNQITAQNMADLGGVSLD